jgi:hypothetical protein
MKNFLYALLALAMFSCGGSSADKPADLLAANDFESLDGWSNGGANASLNKEKAHSGAYSVKVNPGLDYSMGYTNQLGKLSSTRLKKIKVHAWLFVPNDKATAALVTEIKTPGQDKSTLWDGIDMVKEGKSKGYNKWIEIDKTFDVPESANYNSQLLFYLWRGSSTQPVYMDDVQLTRVN